jgi:hypothetical protein
MHCLYCNTLNDPDACFCSACGNPIAGGPRTPSAKAPRAYLFALLLVPVIAIAGGIGYYKFFLPEGIAAVVNGEEIKRSELDAAVVRVEAADPAAGEGRRAAQDGRRLRYEVLSALITERLVLQEARKAGIDISDGDIAAALAHAQASSGLDKAGFDFVVARQYGDGRTFEEAVRREFIIKKFIARKAVSQGGDPQRAGAAMNAWLQDLSARAAVRIALSEQWSGAGCGCGGCDNTKTQTAGLQVLNRGCPMSKAASPAGRAGCGRAKNGTSSEPNKKDKWKYAEEAGLKYWHEKYGPGAVSARLIDFGCHIQVDIVKDEKVIGSLRYQNGTITEPL